MNPEISNLENKIKNLEEEIAKPEVYNNFEKANSLNKELENKRKRLNILKDIDQTEADLKENKKSIEEQETDSNQDQDFLDLLKSERKELETKLRELEAQSQGEGEENSISQIIIEIRAAAGGDESSIFAADLYRMYSRYIEDNSWRKDMINYSKSGLGAVKEIVFEVKGEGCYSKLKGEMGVHRVQRIPVTEKKGRIHTSTATVAVLPIKENKAVNIDKKDLKFDFFCASGAGGQHVNKTCSAVRVTHMPSGIVVSSQNQRSQHQNKDKALQVLQARLEEVKEQEEFNKIDSERKTQIGTGDRSEKIKTYNFPQDRLTDHRIGKNYFGLKKIMDGDIEKIIEDFQEWQRVENQKQKN